MTRNLSVQRPAADLAGILVGAGLDLADEAEEKTSLLLAGLAGRGELLREALEALINLSRNAPSQLWSEAVVVAAEDDMMDDTLLVCCSGNFVERRR